MSGVPGHFARFEGDIPVTGGAGEVLLNVDPRDFRPTGAGGVVLRFGAKAADGTALPLAGLAAGVAPVALTTLADGTAVARVAPGSYRLAVGGTPGQEYSLEIGLAGDADGDRRVGRRDLLAIRRGLFDADGDGRVGESDLALARSNLGASTAIRPSCFVTGKCLGPATAMRPSKFVTDPFFLRDGAVVGDRAPVALRPSLRGGPVADLSGMGAVEALKVGANWIIYEPITARGGQQVGQDQIRRELKVLYDRGFRGIVTYSFFNGREEIPRIAKEIGFQQVIAGIWARDEYAVEKANMTPERARYVDGLVVGNETQLFHVYSLDVLKARMAEMKALSGGKPTATSEAWDRYVPSSQNYIPGLMALGDWVFPNLHPFYERGWAAAHQKPEDGVRFVTSVLRDHFSPEKVGPGRLVALHESWWPSAQDGTPSDPTYRGSGTPANQRIYFEKLAQTSTVFVYGEAFDMPWKGNEGDTRAMGVFGTHWGLWRDASTPKPAVSAIRTGRRPG